MGVFSFCALALFFFAIGLKNSSGQGYVPQFLKKKYDLGNEQPQSKDPSPSISLKQAQASYISSSSYGNAPAYHPYSDSTLKTKTKTKTKTYIKTKSGKYGNCMGVPPSPMNAGMRCSSYGGCRADCIPDYQFPNGKTQIMIACVDGQWKVSDEPSWDSVPSCAPICLPECLNNGICLAPNQCQCPENFSGPQCQFENKPCLNLPYLPQNSKRSCRAKQCTIECMPGHQFPDGSTITTTVCSNGLWLPAKPHWSSVPDCKATCTPPCLNGGNCLSFNVCQCPQDYRGAQCQYSSDVCKANKLQFNGGFNCSGDMSSFSCSIFCPEGIAFEYTPEHSYTCLYETGQFMPSPRPQCIYPSHFGVISHSSSSNSLHSGEMYHLAGGHHSAGSMEEEVEIIRKKIKPIEGVHVDVDQQNNLRPDYYSKTESNVIDLVPKPGSCFTWGGTHYKTFDGRVYSFESKCSHMFLKDAMDNTFSIITQNHPDCFNGKSTCSKIVRVYLQDKEYFLKQSESGVPIFASTKKTIPIPSQLPGLRINMAGNSVVLSLDTLGVILKWDGQQLLHVEVQETMWNRTEGLCGRIDGDKMDDFLLKDGIPSKSITTLASSWKVENLDEPCNDAPSEIHACSGQLDDEATKFCLQVLSDKRFALCGEAIDVTSLLDSCKWDYCSCTQKDRSSCTCGTLEVYVKDCSHKGFKLSKWRDEKICPMKCSDGKIYMACGPKNGQQMCGSASSPTDEKCIEGCYCPEGTVLHENKCIEKDQCPCRLRGKSFSPGASIPKDCNTCTCADGQWECTQISCGARCAAIGDPHYVTFDGKRFDFMGQCSYYLVKTENFTIEAENVACAGSISQAMNFPASVSGGLPSCTKTVTLKYNGQVIKLKQNHDVVVNGIDITKVPYNVSGAVIRAVSSIFLQVELPNGVEIWWDGVTRAYVDLPASFKDKTTGLCGTFNNNQKDDFVTPEGDVEQNVIPFANKWKTSEKCSDIPELLTAHPCDINMHKKAGAEKYCGKIKLDLFKECHWHVDPEQFYQDCLYDMCSCEFQVNKCLCPTMSSYAAECSRKGIQIDWRNEVRECGIQCPGGQKYQICGNSCSRTCSDLTLRQNCKPQCVEGCNCPEGEALDDNGECIPIGQCKCQLDGLEFQAGYKEVRPGTHGMELCTCLNGIWTCKLATTNDIQEFPRANDLKAKCDSSGNFEFSTCEDVEPVTCKNMHTNEHFSPTVCHSGCNCKPGYVLDSKNKKCVKPSDCPCHHGGRSYKEKSTVQSDCNTCTCKNGKWECTKRQCTAECSTWGDSHYKTFDGRHFDYQGQCDFVLAKGNLGSDSFHITIQNVPCGSLGTACSKSLTVRVNSGEDTETITLTKDKPLPRSISKKHVTIREKGIFTIVEAPDLGLVVHWDKGTRVYVKIDPRWKDKVKGLCGNYNDNEADDFQTPSGGLVEASVNIFGDSWRLQDYCPEALELLDSCADKPDRKAWAMKKCGLLKSALFAPCHAEIPLDSYYERCVFDACACDQGGDCQCLCTALAAYAQECNNRGAPVRWRSQQLCPMQCDQRCSVYSPCISTCPLETCDNLLTNSKLTKSCNEDACVEGCSPKVCPPDYVYLNDSYMECVPRNICKPVCLEIDGITFYEGDMIEEDDCHSCYCSRSEKICKGQPCSTTNSPIASTLQNEQNIQCVTGWTSWINQDKAKGRKSKRTDVEPLPSSFLLNNIKTIGKCGQNEMSSIECLTVDGRHPKEIGLDVECSLEKGLVCKSRDPLNACPDFKIRVWCECEEPSTTFIPIATMAPPCDINRPHQEHPRDCHKFLQCSVGLGGGFELVEKTCGPNMYYNPDTMTCDWEDNVLKIKPNCADTVTPGIPVCPFGLVKEECAINCDKLCSYYLYLVREKGMCLEGTKCESGCVSAEKIKECPKGHLWLDENTCVSKHDCMCVSDNDKPVKPGQVIKGNDCKECQCIDNFYSCYKDNCRETTEPPAIEKEEVKLEIIPVFTTVAYLIPSVSPPPECSEDRFIDLVQGDQPLPDSAFSASSVLSEPFAASSARIKPSLKSGGSWAPLFTNQDQYLEIDFGRQEPVYGLKIKGSFLYEEYVTSYMVQFSPDDGTNFYFVLNDESPPRPQIFRGSIDPHTPVIQIFGTPFEAKKIRIKPQTWNNGISLRVGVIGCSAELPSTTPYFYSTRITTPISQCDDEMGVRNGTLVDQQISVSSEASPEFGKKFIRLNSDSAWQPLTDSTTEWIELDFLESRDLTGIVTKGGPEGWVESYIVKYSQNGKDWNPILEPNTQNDEVYPANFDNNSPHVNNFILPINAKYLKIVPQKWHKNIQMRLEVHGCYKPYPILEVPKTTTASYPCNHCPGVAAGNMEMEACRCLSELWFDGTQCVNRTQCPCMVGHISYEVGTVFEKEDCSDCICKLGGVEHCTPKQCNPCKEGLRSTVTSTCKCTCQLCPQNTTLCPSSNICIDSKLWCDGVQDCPDDEVDCIKTTIAPTKKPKTCSIIDCQPGYKKVIEDKKSEASQDYLSPLLTKSQSRKINSKYSSSLYSDIKTIPIKTSAKKKFMKPQNLKQVEEDMICPEYKCVNQKPPPDFIHTIEECPPVQCQPGFIPVLDNYNDVKKSCPTYSCYPQPLPDAVCNVTGRTFNTFDNSEFKYDICNHVIGRDLEHDEWQVSLKKNCSKTCSRDLMISHDKHEIIIRSDLSISYDGYEYTVDQVKSFDGRNRGFSISMLGSTLLFVSDRYGFWIIWNKLANVKFGVVHKLAQKVDGLCGYFNDNPEDDKRKPDGNIARTTSDFGDSWSLSQDQPAWCQPKACPAHIQDKVWEICNKVKEQPLGQCAKALDIEAFVSRCMDPTCDCLEKSETNLTASEECRCSALQSFVVDCLSSDSSIDLSEWRTQQDCPVSCEAPLVYHDCYQRKCEPTCQSIADPYLCPKVSKMCFPGCYCPAGHVRKDDNCIKPSSCRDCECNVLPHLQYVTYDESNFTVSGNCVYVMSRDVANEEVHKWQVLITNHPCKNKPEKMCVGKVTILYQGHKIHILVDYFRNKLKLIVDNERIADFDEIEDWAQVKLSGAKHMKFLMTEVQVEVSVYYPSLGVSVKVPSHKYGGKLEGLCGDCNKNPDDDVKLGYFDKHPGGKPRDMDDFALSWLYENLPGGQTREECGNKPEEECPKVMPSDDPCMQILDANKFGQCLNVMDPSLFLDWCKKDTCGQHPELSCAAIEAFAQDCAGAGFCVNWRNEFCPAQSCPADQHFESCAPSKQKTCDDLKKTVVKSKNNEVLEGCYCSEGKVLLNHTCVLPKDCEVCDDEGHHPGDTWKKDQCTTCRCEGTGLKCETQYCPGKETVCERGYNAIKIPTQEDTCCDKYACVPEPTAGPTCEPPQKLVCAIDQILKLDTKPNGCQAFICECKPRSECPEINLNIKEKLDDGFVKEIDDNGCCPLIKLTCKKETCPKPQNCPQYHTLQTQHINGKCCPLYSCEPPKDKCIFESSYTASDKGGERPLTKLEKQKFLKLGNATWHDGPCRECKCVLTSSGNYQATCGEFECPTLELHEDYSEYELTFSPIPGECCPKIKRKSCKHHGKIYDVGEKWQLDDYCTTYACVDSGNVRLETSKQTCPDNECKLGYQYQKPIKECCGKCTQVSCVADNVVREVGEKWTSDDFCTNYFCQNVNGSLQVESEKVNCPKISKEDLDEFVYEEFSVDGTCCMEVKAIACRVGEKIYQINETWPSPDGDKCKNITCVSKSFKEIIKQDTIENCKKDCPKGWAYQDSNTQCCGECVQTHCIVNDSLKQPSETWKSEDGCITYSCDNLGGQLLVSSNHESCPSLDDCPKENIYSKGCCKYCNVTVEQMTLCSPQPIPLAKTIKMIQVTKHNGNKCENKKEIRDFTECVGTCHSSTFFNIKTGMHESICSCCQAVKYQSLQVELNCEDGLVWTKKIAVPSKCNCVACGEGESSFVTDKSFY